MLLGKLRNMDLEHNYPRRTTHTGPMVSVIYHPLENTKRYIIKDQKATTCGLSGSRVAVAGSRGASVCTSSTCERRFQLIKKSHELRYTDCLSLYPYFFTRTDTFICSKYSVFPVFGAPISSEYNAVTFSMCFREITPPSNLEKNHEKTKYRRN